MQRKKINLNTYDNTSHMMAFTIMKCIDNKHRAIINYLFLDFSENVPISITVEDVPIAGEKMGITEVNSQNGSDSFNPLSPKVLYY